VVLPRIINTCSWRLSYFRVSEVLIPGIFYFTSSWANPNIWELERSFFFFTLELVTMECRFYFISVVAASISQLQFLCGWNFVPNEFTHHIHHERIFLQSQKPVAMIAGLPVLLDSVFFFEEFGNIFKFKQTNSVAFSPLAKYTDWATATCWPNLVPIFADRGMLRC
jgi:hypothetical protein